jgi:hypothetical protein
MARWPAAGARPVGCWPFPLPIRRRRCASNTNSTTATPRPPRWRSPVSARSRACLCPGEKKPRGKGFPPGPRVERVQRSKLVKSKPAHRAMLQDAHPSAKIGPCLRIKDLPSGRRVAVSRADRLSAHQPPRRCRDAREVQHPAPADQGTFQLPPARCLRGGACRRDFQPGADWKTLDVVVLRHPRPAHSMPMRLWPQTGAALGSQAQVTHVMDIGMTSAPQERVLVSPSRRLQFLHHLSRSSSAGNLAGEP